MTNEAEQFRPYHECWQSVTRRTWPFNMQAMGYWRLWHAYSQRLPEPWDLKVLERTLKYLMWQIKNGKAFMAQIHLANVTDPEKFHNHYDDMLNTATAWAAKQAKFAPKTPRQEVLIQSGRSDRPNTQDTSKPVSSIVADSLAKFRRENPSIAARKEAKSHE